MALALADEGIELIFAERCESGQISGYQVGDPETWVPVARVPVAAAYDRFPVRRQPERFAALVRGLGDVPIGNPPALMALFQDKLATWDFAREHGLPMPEVAIDVQTFGAHLTRWGHGYLKPRFGTAGRDVAYVRAGQPLPERVPGPTTAVDGPRFLQRAIRPFPPWSGVCVRVLAQRRDDGGWHFCPAVARYSEHDRVVNAARGSQIALAAEFLPADSNRAIAELCARACTAAAARPGGEWLVEVGLDLVIDERGAPWLLELNSRPLGRLSALAAAEPERFSADHQRALARPVRFLAARARRVR